MSTRTRINLLAMAIIAAAAFTPPAAAVAPTEFCDFAVIAPALQEESATCRAGGGLYSVEVTCHADGTMSWVGTCTV